jgi:hypothetical protein
VADHSQSAGLAGQGSRQIVQDDGSGFRAVRFSEGLPDLRLRILNEGDDILGENRPLAVERG